MAGSAPPTARACRTSSVPAPNLPAHPFPAPPVREDFDSPELPIDFQWLRSPYPERLWSLTERPGFLRLFGRETLGSQFEQALVARRQQAHCFTAATRMEFQPEHFQQAAGLILYYHATKFHYLFLTEDDTIGRHLRVMSCVTDVGDSFTLLFRCRREREISNCAWMWISSG